MLQKTLFPLLLYLALWPTFIGLGWHIFLMFNKLYLAPEWHWQVTRKTVIFKIQTILSSRLPPPICTILDWLNPGNYQMCKTHQITNYFLSLISHYISLILEHVTTCQQQNSNSKIVCSHHNGIYSFKIRVCDLFV